MAWRSYETRHRPLENYHAIGLHECDVIALAQAMQLCGFWKLDIDKGLFFGTKQISDIFEIEHIEGPMNIQQLAERIHPDDLDHVSETYFRACSARGRFHTIHRIITSTGVVKHIRSVGLHRATDIGSGEYRGMLHELFPLQPMASVVAL
ncbi:hypothetical protein [Allorhizobium taibaishanense]|uniref:PAS fold-3 domain-containing protein n=1 Tax=Allorhizobium taibaishanense TaxID=887144 RepID=A0A7W6HJI1_9HYPH|nr:hypothetical protein [Allorhizobium taibaishanense]MBB4006397.1 hypothetical protein [Allorhizobium taibaishanense]